MAVCGILYWSVFVGKPTRTNSLLTKGYDRTICVHQNKSRDKSMRESRPLLSSTDIEELRPTNLDAGPAIDRDDLNDDRTDFEIPTFRYVY